MASSATHTPQARTRSRPSHKRWRPGCAGVRGRPGVWRSGCPQAEHPTFVGLPGLDFPRFSILSPLRGGIHEFGCMDGVCVLFFKTVCMQSVDVLLTGNTRQVSGW